MSGERRSKDSDFVGNAQPVMPDRKIYPPALKIVLDSGPEDNFAVGHSYSSEAALLIIFQKISTCSIKTAGGYFLYC